jgi:hypothetical protein
VLQLVFTNAYLYNSKYSTGFGFSCCSVDECSCQSGSSSLWGYKGASLYLLQGSQSPMAHPPPEPDSNQCGWWSPLPCFPNSLLVWLSTLLYYIQPVSTWPISPNVSEGASFTCYWALSTLWSQLVQKVPNSTFVCWTLPLLRRYFANSLLALLSSTAWHLWSAFCGCFGLIGIYYSVSHLHGLFRSELHIPWVHFGPLSLAGGYILLWWISQYSSWLVASQIGLGSVPLYLPLIPAYWTLLSGLDRAFGFWSEWLLQTCLVPRRHSPISIVPDAYGGRWLLPPRRRQR